MRKSIVFALLFIITYLLLFFSGQIYHENASGYATIIGFLVLGIIVILSGCELFANGVECLGERLGLSHAASGSLLAASGTALPETSLPVLALIFGTAEHRESIAVGAILGSSFMIATVAMFLTGLTSLVLRLMRKKEKAIHNVNIAAMRSQLTFFIAVMAGTLIVSILKIQLVNYIYAFVILFIYTRFIKSELSHMPEDGEEYSERFHFGIILACPRNYFWIISQVLTGLLLIIVGAHIFVNFLTLLSIKSGVPSLILALLIAPIATELPEIFNSVSWTIKKKDTLAISNVSGAMVFQATIPVSIGLLFTAWHLGTTELLNIIFSLSIASIILMNILIKKRLSSFILLTGGIFYVIYVLRIFVLL
ncbi:MAG: sodium:calcium antiporter [Thermodesulfovibrionales bacterium]